MVTAAMAGTIFLLSGRATLRERMSVAEVVSLVRRYDQGSMGNVAFLASVAPAIADALFFLPWGALAFLSFDARNQTRRGRTYLLVLGLGVAFALVLAAWQDMLPTRVTGWDDVAWNTMGCLAGAAAAHLRKRVRIRFE
jgi:VanZ like family.